MDTQGKEFKRVTQKFTPQEEEILFQLISSYSDIIDNNKIDVLSQQKKKQAWDEIEQKFNTMSTRKRSAQSLKDKFSNSKKRKRAKTSHGPIKTEEDDGFVDGLSSMTDEQKRDVIMDIIGVPSPSGLREETDPQGKEKRQPNFSQKEEEFLTHLVSLHRNIIDTRKNDTVTAARKKAAWEKITKEFNTLSPLIRSVQSLKDKWCKIKTNQRARTGEPSVDSTVTPAEMTTDTLKSGEDYEASMDLLETQGTSESFDGHEEELENRKPEEELHELRLLLLQEELSAKRELNRLQIEEKKRDMEMKEELHRARLENLIDITED